MHCLYCRFWNSDDEYRCRRCGRHLRPAVTSPAPETRTVHNSEGALAQATRFAPASAPAEADPPQPAASRSRVSRQRSLFAENVVAINPVVPQPRPASGRSHRLRRRTPDYDQPQLDFLPAAPRKLKTSVEASIYCDAPVARPLHRAIASALDGSIIFISAALFLVTFWLLGGRLPANKETVLFVPACVGLLILFYGAIWALAGRPTPGMRWTRLEIINFDGFPPDRRQRGLRFLAACLSFCALGLGLVWALVDEESLTWHDHMSQTFPTFKEADNTPFRRL